MNICIAERFYPFSHSFGQAYLIPQTDWQVQVFPCLLKFHSFSSSQRIEWSLSLQGPIDPFTAEQDLERPSIRVFGESRTGYFRFLIQREEDQLVLLFEKTPPEGVLLHTSTQKEGLRCYKASKIVIASLHPFNDCPVQERLFLGVSKQPDWDLIRRRKDMKEILPFWHRIGLLSPSVDEKDGSPSAVLGLLNICEQKIQDRDKQGAYEALVHLFQVGFSQGLVPRLRDEEHQGILSSEMLDYVEGNPLVLVKRGSSLIRSLFFQEKNGIYHILPCLPISFVFGRMVQLSTEKQNRIDLEWSKKQLRRMKICVHKDGELKFRWPSYVEQYRLRRSFQDKGRILEKIDSIQVKAGEELWLDRFQK
jgi:hypothetical protein